MKTLFEKKLIARALLSCALSVSLLETVSAKPMILRRPILSDRVFNGSKNLPQAEMLFGGAPIPLMTDALNYAKIGRIGRGGAKAAIYATVIIASTSSQFTPGRQTVRYANGVMRLSGQNSLVGDLAEYWNITRGDVVFERRERSTFRLSVRADGFISITTTSRPLKKEIVLRAAFKPSGTEGMLWGMADFGGGRSLISIALTKGVDPLDNASTPPVDAPAPSGLRGMKVRVTPSFKIMKSDDGTGFFKKDTTVELYGSLLMGNRKVWSRSLNNELSAKQGNAINGQSVDVDVYFDNAQTWRINVSGSLEDSDKPSVNSDIVWKGDENVDLKAAIEQQGGQVVLKGQADDEYADLRLNVEKISDLN